MGDWDPKKWIDNVVDAVSLKTLDTLAFLAGVLVGSTCVADVEKAREDDGLDSYDILRCKMTQGETPPYSPLPAPACQPRRAREPGRAHSHHTSKPHSRPQTTRIFSETFTTS